MAALKTRYSFTARGSVVTDKDVFAPGYRPSTRSSPLLSAIGRFVQQRRTVLNIDQKTLSELSGVAVHTISSIESGCGNPTVAVFNRVLTVLGLELQIKVGNNES